MEDDVLVARHVEELLQGQTLHCVAAVGELAEQQLLLHPLDDHRRRPEAQRCRDILVDRQLVNALKGRRRWLGAKLGRADAEAGKCVPFPRPR